ncbi:hypothetical protein CCP3SC1AL1_2330002 [Gammaproteobacteria bacterium]
MCQHSSSKRDFLRKAVGVSAGLAVYPFLGKNTFASPSLAASGGCCLVGAQAAKIIDRLSQLAASGEAAASLIQSSGEERLDRLLGATLANIAGTFEVRPGFAFYEDGEDPNALALPESYLPSTNGTVLLGRSLLHNELARSANGDMALTAICAHEFAHIAQYAYQCRDRLLRDQTTHKLVELHADFLAGYFLGNNKSSLKSDQLIEIGLAWQNLGDSNFTDPYHHGTQEERLHAVEAGFRSAKLPMATAVEVGMKSLWV